MLQFLNTIFLWALPLISLPVLIHLFNRRRRQPVPWGAMRFLMQAATRRRRIWRLTDLLLLLLRMAILALIILALAQPSIRWGSLGGHVPRDVVIVLDASLSTALHVDGGRVFDHQVEQVRQTVDRLDENDFVRLMVLDGGRDWLMPVAEPVTEKTRSRIDSLLRGLEPSRASADLLMGLCEAAQAESAASRTVRVVVLVTDGRAYGWHADTPASWKSLPLEFLEQTGRGRVCVLSELPKDVSASNLALVSLTATHSTIGVGQIFELTATVSNTADQQTPACLVSWTMDGSPLGSSNLPALKPGGKTKVKIETSLQARGPHTVRCQVELPDDLPMDNDESLVLEAVDKVPVLVVEGRREPRLIDCGAGYLMAAMGYANGSALPLRSTVLQPRLIDLFNLDDEPLDQYHAIVLTDIGRLSRSQVVRLSEYVRRGGGVWLALGGQMDWETFNRDVYADGQGLSPLPMRESVGDAEDHQRFSMIQPPLEYHRSTAMLSDIQRLDIDKVRIYRRHRFRMDMSLRNLGVLLTNENGEPLVIEYPHGRGRVFIQTFPLDMSWSNLSICRSFVVMAHEWLWYLSEPSANRWNLHPGESLGVRMAGDFAEAASVVTPSEQRHDLYGVAEDGGQSYSFTQTQAPGLYQLVLENGDGVTQIHPFHVHRLAGESDLTPLSEEAIQSIGTVSGVQFTGDLDEPMNTDNVPPSYQPVWNRLLMALLAFLMFETLLGGLLTLRRQAGMSAPAMLSSRPASATVPPVTIRAGQSQPVASTLAGRNGGNGRSGQSSGPRSKSDIAAKLFDRMDQGR